MRGRRALLSAICCAIILALIGSLYFLRPLTPLDMTHRRFVIPNQFCGCSDEVAIYVKSGSRCPAGLQGKATSCPRSSSLYQHFVPRNFATSASVAASPTGTADVFSTVITVPGLAQSCSGTAASCSTSYIFSWIGGAAVPTSAAGGITSAMQSSSVMTTSASGGPSLVPSTSSSTLTFPSNPMSTITITSAASWMNPSVQISYQSLSGIMSSWTTTGTFMEDHAVVISSYVAGMDGENTIPLCALGTEVWQPVSTTSTISGNVSAIAKPGGSTIVPDVWTTTITAQQGINTVILALENTLASNGATEILSTLASSTVSPPSAASRSMAGMTSTAVWSYGYTNSSTMQTTPASVNRTLAAVWTTTMTIVQGSITVVDVGLVSKATEGTLVASQLSASTLASAVAAGLPPTSLLVSPIPGNITVSNGNTGSSFPHSSNRFGTATNSAGIPPFVNSTTTVASMSSAAIGVSTVQTMSASSPIFTATTSPSSLTAQSLTISYSANTAWSPLGSIVSSRTTYTIGDGAFGGEVMVGEISWLVSSINPTSMQSFTLGVDVISLIPFSGSPSAGTTTQASLAVVTTSSSLSTSVAPPAGPSAPVAAHNGVSGTVTSTMSSSVTSALPIVISSNTRISTITVQSTTASSSNTTAEGLPAYNASSEGISDSAKPGAGKLKSGKKPSISSSMKPPEPSLYTSTYASTYCDIGGGFQDGHCANTKTRHYTRTWYGKREDALYELETANIPLKFRRDVDEGDLGLDTADQPNSEMRRRRVHPFYKNEKISAVLDSIGIDTANTGPRVTSHQVLPAPLPQITQHPAHTSRASDGQQLSARGKKGITICAKDNCDVSVTLEPAGVTICTDLKNCGGPATTHNVGMTICAEENCGVDTSILRMPRATASRVSHEQLSARDDQGITICAEENCGVSITLEPAGVTICTDPKDYGGPATTQNGGITTCIEENCGVDTSILRMPRATTAQVNDGYQISAREPQGITICAEANCVGETSVVVVSIAPTVTIFASDTPPVQTGAPFIPESQAQRVYRGVRWCFPWFGCVTFELVFGVVMAGMWTLVIFQGW
jgi:hypothetical protein